MKGGSTWSCPKLPNNIKLNTNRKKKNLDNILKLLPLIKLRSVTGNTNNIRIAPNIVTTPPNFEGIDLKIA